MSEALRDAIHRYQAQSAPSKLQTASKGKAYRVHAAYWSGLWGSRPVAEIKPSDIRAWQAELLRAGTLKPATIYARQAFLSSVFELLRAEEVLQANPCRAAGWVRVRNGKTRVLTEDEEARLLAALHPDTAAFVRFLLNTGLRAGEGLALEWGDIHENRAWIRPQKTPSGRHLPLNETALGILAQRRHLERPWPDAYVLVSGRVSRACAKLGLEGVTLHTARHTFATRLLRSGASLLHVKRCLGHSDWSMTERYSHLLLDDLQEAVGRLDGRSAPEAPEAPDLAALVAQLSAQVAALTARLPA
ncbi:MAG: hypothetical protein AMXMBFR33_41400 [Candidatus Xenobia bacterium]